MNVAKKYSDGAKHESEVEVNWNVMTHAQKSDFVFRRNGWVHFNRRGRQFSPLLAADVCASAVVVLDTSCSEVVWRVLATHSIRQFPLHFPSRASPCAITFQLKSSRQYAPWHEVDCHNSNFNLASNNLYLRHRRCVCNNEIKGKVSQVSNTKVTNTRTNKQDYSTDLQRHT